MSGSPPRGASDSDPDPGSLLQRHLPALRAFVRLRLGPGLAARESASDIVQSVCRELVEQRDRFRFEGEGAFKSWLYSAAVHKIHQRGRHWRARKRDLARELDDRAAGSQDDEQSLLASYAHVATPSHEAAMREEIDRVEAAFGRLSPSDRELVVMAKIAQLPHAEIAALTGRSEEACRTALRRALVRLAAHLDPGGPDDAPAH